ncbi:MAG: Transcriptional regulator, Crp/Fnr family [uncultured bacterium]|nr:MAG: Transcriptional regulator, Crp/Fnr family [uncultured bacterium]HCS38434.1 hypothetical protein [Anaerolineaceae bacterium]
MTIQSTLPGSFLEGLKLTLSKIEHFKALPIEAQNAIIDVAIPRQYKAGQVIYLEGEPAEYVYILEKGWVKATRMTHEGREQGLLFLRPVEIFGDIAVFSGTSYPGTVTALEDVEAWLIPSQVLMLLVKQYPALALAIIQRLSERVLHYIGLVEDLSLRSVEARLASTLLRNAELQNEQLVVSRREWTTLDEMAVRLGTVRDVLSRAMKVLETENLIIVNKQSIQLINPQGLAERAER